MHTTTWQISSIAPSAVTFSSWRAWLLSLHKGVISYLLPQCLSLLTNSPSKFHPVAAPRSVPASYSQPKPSVTLQDSCQHYHTFSHFTTSSLREQLQAAFKTHMYHGFIQQHNDVFCFAASSFPGCSLLPPPVWLMLHSFPPQDASKCPFWVVIANAYSSTYHCFSPHYFYIHQRGISSAILSPTHSVSCSSLFITAYYSNLMEKQAHYGWETHALFHWLRGCLCWRWCWLLEFLPSY